MSRKVHQEPMLQACCGARGDAFQLASGVSFYSAIAEIIFGPVGLEGVLWEAPEKFYCSANTGIIWFAEICEQNPNQITTIHLNLYLHTFSKLGILQHSKTSSTRDEWRGLCSLKSELFKTRKSM